MIEGYPAYLIVLIGFLVTEPWRWMGMYFSKDLDENSEIIIWVRAVSTALIAALIARLILTPPGILAETHVSIRVISLLFSTMVFFVCGKRLLLTIFSGLVCFLILVELTSRFGLFS